jgi:mycoredoxin
MHRWIACCTVHDLVSGDGPPGFGIEPNPTRWSSTLIRNGSGPMLIIYSTPTCGYCQRLKSQLDREGIPFTDIDIERDPAAAAYVASVNGGYQTVPTVLCPNGSAMTNPTIQQIKECLTPSGA